MIIMKYELTSPEAALQNILGFIFTISVSSGHGIYQQKQGVNPHILNANFEHKHKTYATEEADVTW